MTPVSRGARRPAPSAGLGSGVAIAAIGWLALTALFAAVALAIVGLDRVVGRLAGRRHPV